MLSFAVLLIGLGFFVAGHGAMECFGTGTTKLMNPILSASFVVHALALTSSSAIENEHVVWLLFASTYFFHRLWETRLFWR